MQEQHSLVDYLVDEDGKGSGDGQTNILQKWKVKILPYKGIDDGSWCPVHC